MGKKANTQLMIVEDIKKKIQSNQRLHQLFDRFADTLIQEEKERKRDDREELKRRADAQQKTRLKS